MLRAEAVELLARAMRQEAALDAEATAIWTARAEADRAGRALLDKILVTFSHRESQRIYADARHRACGGDLATVTDDFGAGAPDGEAKGQETMSAEILAAENEETTARAAWELARGKGPLETLARLAWEAAEDRLLAAWDAVNGAQEQAE